MTDILSLYNSNRLQWDETNLTLHEIEREQQEARMKIDEPKTPFVHGATLTPVGDDEMFDLDGSAPSTSSAGGSRRSSSAADQLASNTSANAGRSGSGLGLAIGLDAADLARSSTTNAASEVEQRPMSARSTSRSPSFSLPPKSPSSRRSSSRSATAAAADERSEVRQQANEMEVDDAGLEGDGEVEEEDADPETQAKHAAFAAKRNQHYGNEAEAMKIAAALAAQEDEEDEEEEDNEGGLPPVRVGPNGSGAR